MISRISKRDLVIETEQISLTVFGVDPQRDPDFQNLYLWYVFGALMKKDLFSKNKIGEENSTVDVKSRRPHSLLS